jgi:hypothetical protein
VSEGNQRLMGWMQIPLTLRVPRTAGRVA